jgi:hypothetical protein
MRSKIIFLVFYLICFSGLVSKIFCATNGFDLTVKTGISRTFGYTLTRIGGHVDDHYQNTSYDMPFPISQTKVFINQVTCKQYWFIQSIKNMKPAGLI